MKRLVNLLQDENVSFLEAFRDFSCRKGKKTSLRYHIFMPEVKGYYFSQPLSELVPLDIEISNEGEKIDIKCPFILVVRGGPMTFRNRQDFSIRINTETERIDSSPYDISSPKTILRDILLNCLTWRVFFEKEKLEKEFDETQEELKALKLKQEQEQEQKQPDTPELSNSAQQMIADLTDQWYSGLLRKPINSYVQLKRVVGKMIKEVYI